MIVHFVDIGGIDDHLINVSFHNTSSEHTHTNRFYFSYAQGNKVKSVYNTFHSISIIINTVAVLLVSETCTVIQ